MGSFGCLEVIDLCELPRGIGFVWRFSILGSICSGRELVEGAESACGWSSGHGDDLQADGLPRKWVLLVSQ